VVPRILLPLLLLLASFAFSAEGLSSNYVYIVAPGAQAGSLRAVSQGNGNSAVNLIAVDSGGYAIQSVTEFTGGFLLNDPADNLFRVAGPSLELPWYAQDTLRGVVVFDALNQYATHFDTSAVRGFSRTQAVLESVAARHPLDGAASLLARPLTSACEFPVAGGTGLAVASDGGGVAYSLDGGVSWLAIVNQSPVGNNLSSVRVVPSVLRFAGANAQIAYKVSQESRVTIEVFSYDMRPVRTIVKNALRLKSAVRSSDPVQDVWDGKDSAGKAVALGVYYIKVSDNHGHTGWGKAMVLGGNR
jgi:hypothetical protein